MKANPVIVLLITISVPLIAVVGPAFNIGTLVTSIYIPLFFILSLLSKKNGHSLKFIPIRLYLLFFLLSLVSFVNATDADSFLGEVKTQVGCIIFGIAIFNYIIINPVYLKYFFFSCILTTYAFSFYLLQSGVLDMQAGDDLTTRIEDDTFNANVFPYYMFLSSFAFFFLFHLQKSRIIRLLYFLSLPLYLYIIFSSGSRGGLLIFLLIQILYWFYIGTGKVRSVYKSTMKLVAVILLSLPVLANLFIMMLEETNIGKRFDALSDEGESTIRVVLLKLAFDKFQEYPFLGLGSGNFRVHNQFLLYSHNNFMEILVNNGIFTFIAYVAIFIVTYQYAMAIKKKTNNLSFKKSADIIILFVFGFCLYSFFYVFMNVIPFTGFIFCLFSILYLINYHIQWEAPNKQIHSAGV